MGAIADADAASPTFLADLTDSARSSCAVTASSSTFCWVCARRARVLESSAREANESAARPHHPSRSARHVSRRVRALLPCRGRFRVSVFGVSQHLKRRGPTHHDRLLCTFTMSTVHGLGLSGRPFDATAVVLVDVSCFPRDPTYSLSYSLRISTCVGLLSGIAYGGNLQRRLPHHVLLLSKPQSSPETTVRR